MEPARGEESSTRADPSLAVRTTEIEDLSVRGFFDVAQAESGDADLVDASATPWVVWRTPEGDFLAAIGASASCVADGAGRFASIREEGSELFAALESDLETSHTARPRLFGGFSFLSDTHDGPWAGVPDARFVLPEVQFASTEEGNWLTVIGDPQGIETRLDDWHDRVAAVPDPASRTAPSIEHAERTTSRARWHEQVETALSRIGSRLRKVVLAQSLSVTLDDTVSMPGTLSRLAGSYPECFCFSFPPGEGKRDFFGATPERLVSVCEENVTTGALAGSIERGATDAEDDRLARALADSEKNDREHALVAEAIADQLDSIAQSVTIGEREVRKLATVQHLYTPIEAELAGDEHVLSLVEALHPTPAVGGLPPDVASETIHEIEAFDRGWYAAPVGWFDAAGDGSFAVAIRSAVADGKQATLFAGNGIVAGSDPSEEWEEVQLKYRPILDALGL
ncbi:isochorismate synthase [Halobacteriales archaeon QS_3_64_16]|nr:MAG: isochorismate synthase [Halobacteriales archaeon QS_3_64_16]